MINVFFDNKIPVKSPCTSVCKINVDLNLCQGCLRTLDEIAAWSNSSDDAKRRVLTLIEQRKKTMVNIESPK